MDSLELLTNISCEHLWLGTVDASASGLLLLLRLSLPGAHVGKTAGRGAEPYGTGASVLPRLKLQRGCQHGS